MGGRGMAIDISIPVYRQYGNIQARFLSGDLGTLKICEIFEKKSLIVGGGYQA